MAFSVYLGVRDLHRILYYIQQLESWIAHMHIAPKTQNYNVSTTVIFIKNTVIIVVKWWQ